MQKNDARTTDVYARTSLRLRRALGIVGVSFASLGSGPCMGPCPESYEQCYPIKDLAEVRAQYLEAGCYTGLSSGVAGGAGAPGATEQPFCGDPGYKAMRDWDPSSGCPPKQLLWSLDYEYGMVHDADLPTAPKSKLTCCETIEPGCPGGRPFVVHGQARLPALLDGRSTEGRTPLSAALARVWADDGRAEYASIASFARLTLQLMAFGAPPRLIEASQQASLDEHRHAGVCFAEAARHAGRRVEPGPLDIGQACAEVSF